MAGEALPWMLRRTLDTLNEHDRLPQNHHSTSQVALVPFLELCSFRVKAEPIQRQP